MIIHDFSSPDKTGVPYWGRIMKKFLVFILIFAMVFSLQALPAGAQEDTASQPSSHGLQAQVPVGGSSKLLDTAGSVLLYELNTDTLVYAYNADKRINPTGMVKLLTVLVALEQGNLDDVVIVRRNTLDTVAIGAVSANLKANEQITLRDLIYCVMVSSANDAAAVIAAHIGGNQAGFVEKLNQKAQELGCQDSYFANAHGLNHPDQYSTARDLAIITEAALKNELFAQMFSTITYTVPATNLSAERKLTTTNHMMNEAYLYSEYDSRVTGGKPAAATTTDRSMICIAESGNKRYLCVVMNVKGEVSADGLSVVRYGIFQETKALLNFGFQKMQVVQLVDDSQVLYQYAVDGGRNDVLLRSAADISSVLPMQYDPQLLRYSHAMDDGALKAPVTRGQKLGTLQIYYGDLLIGSCGLLAINDVLPHGEGIQSADRLDVQKQDTDGGLDPYFVLALLAGGAVLVIAGVIWIIVRLVRTADIRRMQRKRARNRKRSK